MLPEVIEIERRGLRWRVPALWVLSCNLRRDDLVRDAGGAYLPADQFLALQPYLPQPAPRDVVGGVVKGALIGTSVVLGAYGLAKLLDHFLSPRPTPRRSLSMDLRDDVSRRDGWRCSYCGKRVNRRTRHIDHATSLANGGKDDWDNWVTACAACNLEKGALNAGEYLAGAGYS